MPQLNDTITSSPRNRISGSGGKARLTGETVAELFKYYRQIKDPTPGFRGLPPGRVSARPFYRKHAEVFDRAARFFISHDLDARRYIEFAVNSLCLSGRDVDTDLLSKKSFVSYVAHLSAIERRRRIYGWFSKSVVNIVDMCMTGGYASAKDCMLALIRSRRLAQEFIAGRISRYFLAAMPNFRDVIPKLDGFARSEFAELYDRFDMYNTEINDAFLTYRNRTVNPLAVVDAELVKRRAAAKPRNDDIFDPDL